MDLGAGEKLTTVRSADNILLYGTSWQDVVTMLEFFGETLQRAGLEINTSKTKILTTHTMYTPMYIDIADDMVEILYRKMPANILEYSYLAI